MTPVHPDAMVRRLQGWSPGVQPPRHRDCLAHDGDTSRNLPLHGERWRPAPCRGWRRQDRVARLGRPLPPDEPSLATYDTDGHHVVENMQVDATVYRAHLAEERIIEREARLRSVTRTSGDATEYLNLVVDVLQRLAERRLARACRPVVIRAPRPRGRTRRVQRRRRVAVRRATADSGGSSDGDPEPPRPPSARAWAWPRGPPVRCQRRASRRTTSGCPAWVTHIRVLVRAWPEARRKRPTSKQDVSAYRRPGQHPFAQVSSRMRPETLFVCPQLARLHRWRVIALH